MRKRQLWSLCAGSGVFQGWLWQCWCAPSFGFSKDSFWKGIYIYAPISLPVTKTPSPMQIIKKAPPGRVEAGKGAAQVQPGVPTPLFYPLNFHRLSKSLPALFPSSAMVLTKVGIILCSLLSDFVISTRFSDWPWGAVRSSCEYTAHPILLHPFCRHTNWARGTWTWHYAPVLQRAFSSWAPFLNTKSNNNFISRQSANSPQKRSKHISEG